MHRIATCRIKSQARKLHASTAIVNSLKFRFDIYISSDYSSVLVVIRDPYDALLLPTGPGFNIEYQNWPWIEGHRNVSLSIISEY